jgi:hypothetical protein
MSLSIDRADCRHFLLDSITDDPPFVPGYRRQKLDRTTEAVELKLRNSAQFHMGVATLQSVENRLRRRGALERRAKAAMSFANRLRGLLANRRPIEATPMPEASRTTERAARARAVRKSVETMTGTSPRRPKIRPVRL